MSATTEGVERAVGNEGVRALVWHRDIATRKADADGRRRATKAKVRMRKDPRDLARKMTKAADESYDLSLGEMLVCACL